MSSKQEILDAFSTQLRQQLATMMAAAKNTHDASTGEEAKQEGKYDTRGLEASYLADAQAEQTQLLSGSLQVLESLQLDDLPIDSPIVSGAIVETESRGEIGYYLLIPCAGGLSMGYEAGELTTLSPDAPLHQALLGKNVGDIIKENDMIILDVQ